MKKQLTIKQKNARARGWILGKNLYPFLMILLICIALAIPCLRYTTADTGTNETISQWELMGNSWDQSRQYLFGGGEQTSGNVLFCRTVLGTLIGFFLAFFVGAAALIFAAVGAIYYMVRPTWQGTGRALYLTLFPNRVAVCLWGALMLPILIFPRLLVFFYRRYFYYSVLLNVTFGEPMVIGGVLFVLFLALVIGFAKWEERTGLSPFPKKKQKGLPEVEEDAEPTFSSADPMEDELTARAREEQMERIRRLLDKTGEVDDSEENEHRNERDDT